MRLWSCKLLQWLYPLVMSMPFAFCFIKAVNEKPYNHQWTLHNEPCVFFFQKLRKIGIYNVVTVSMTTTSPLGRTFYCGALNVKEMWGFSDFLNRRIKLVLHQNRPPKDRHLHRRIFAAAYWHFLPLLGKPSSWCGLLQRALGAWCAPAGPCMLWTSIGTGPYALLGLQDFFPGCWRSLWMVPRQWPVSSWGGVHTAGRLASHQWLCESASIDTQVLYHSFLQGPSLLGTELHKVLE